MRRLDVTGDHRGVSVGEGAGGDTGTSDDKENSNSRANQGGGQWLGGGKLKSIRR